MGHNKLRSLLGPPVIATTPVDVSLGRQCDLPISTTYSEGSLYTGYTTKLLLPQEFRLGSVLTQEVPQVACGSLDARDLKE